MDYHMGPHKDSNMGPHMNSHMDPHMGFHKGKMIPIPIGHGKSGIPMLNFVIVARATFLLEGACSQLASGLPKIWTYNNTNNYSKTGDLIYIDINNMMNRKIVR